MSDNLRRICLFIAWLVSLTAMIATLYASVVNATPVCHLCWYQRICIYPLVLIIGIACFRDDFKVWMYALPLAIIGGIFGVYQYLQQMIPGFAPIDVCGPGPSCSNIHLQWLGFITFPFLTVVACVVISALVLIAGCCSKK